MKICLQNLKKIDFSHKGEAIAPAKSIRKMQWSGKENNDN